MERNGKTLIISLILILSVSVISVFSVDTEEPEWILYRKGINYYNSKDFSEAFKYFREAAVKRDFPEAEYYIGRIFENEGDFSLALKQYERAESYIGSLFTPSFEKIILMQKAEVYKKMGRHNEYEKIIIKLIKDTADEKNIAPYLRLLPEKILENGLDQLMFYYRLDGDEIIYPAGELGVYYFTLSQDNNAVRYLTPAVTASLSKVFLILREYDPQYSYTVLENLINDAEKNRNIIKYLETVHFYKNLFYLSLTLHNAGKTDDAYRILKIISESRYSGKYRDIAGRIVENRGSILYIEKVKESLLLPVE